jgi:hypothetical protein
MLHGAVFLAARLSRSRPPRLGPSPRSRRMRSASPTPDPAVTRKGLAPIEDDGVEQETGACPSRWSAISEIERARLNMR